MKTGIVDPHARLATIASAIAICLSGCSSPVVEHDLSVGGPSLGQPAILEYKYAPMTLSGVDLIEVDGRTVDTGYKKQFRNNLFKLAPGSHRIRFRGDEGWSVRPEVVEFEAKPGKRYVPGCERVNFSSTEGQVTTFYFNFVSPVVSEERDGKLVKIAAGAPTPFKTGLDIEKNVLLYEDSTLPNERTARLYFPRRGGDSVYIVSISGKSGDTRVEYQRSKFDLSQYYGALPGFWTDPRRLRLLPGEYQFKLTLDPQSHVPGAATAQEAARLSDQKTFTLKVEPGHTYRVNTSSKNEMGFDVSP